MSTEIALSEQELTLKGLSRMLNGTALPDRYESVDDAIATIMVGRELALPPMASLNELYVVNGSVGMSGKAMVSLVFRAGHAIYTELSEDIGTAVAWRRDPVDGVLREVGTYTFTAADAERAGLSGKNTYEKFPADMLGWKAVARAVRFAFPDVVMGYMPSEIGIEAPSEGPIIVEDDLPSDVMREQHEAMEEYVEAEVVAEMLDGKEVE